MRRRAEVLEAWRARGGLSMPEVATKLGMTPEAFAVALRRAGKPTPPRPEFKITEDRTCAGTCGRLILSEKAWKQTTERDGKAMAKARGLCTACYAREQYVPVIEPWREEWPILKAAGVLPSEAARRLGVDESLLR